MPFTLPVMVPIEGRDLEERKRVFWSVVEECRRKGCTVEVHREPSEEWGGSTTITMPDDAPLPRFPGDPETDAEAGVEVVRQVEP